MLKNYQSILINRSGQAIPYTYSDLDDFAEIKEPVNGVHGFCFCGDKLVLVWSDKKGYWTLPGGSVETGESAEEATVREIKEETNMRVKKLIPMGVMYLHEPTKTYVQTRSYCEVEPYGEFTCDPDGDIDKIAIIDPQDFHQYVHWKENGEHLLKQALEIKIKN